MQYLQNFLDAYLVTSKGHYGVLEKEFNNIKEVIICVFSKTE